MEGIDWLSQTKRFTVNYCAYGMTYKKPTHIWTTLTEWQPKGLTESGMCNRKCGQLIERGPHEKATLRSRHKHSIAGEASRLPPGPNRKQQLWKLPTLLQTELLELVQEKHTSKQFIFDMFSGAESWRKQVEVAGYSYVPVDVRRAG
jgi:hypothetical protein